MAEEDEAERGLALERWGTRFASVDVEQRYRVWFIDGGVPAMVALTRLAIGAWLLVALIASFSSARWHVTSAMALGTLPFFATGLVVLKTDRQRRVVEYVATVVICAVGLLGMATYFSLGLLGEAMTFVAIHSFFCSVVRMRWWLLMAALAPVVAFVGGMVWSARANGAIGPDQLALDALLVSLIPLAAVAINS